MVNKINLSRRAARASKPPGVASAAPQMCSELDLPENLQALFKKYDLSCPITIPRQASYYEYTYIKLFIEEVVKTVAEVKNVNVDYLRDGKFVVDVHEKQGTVENILKPLFREPDRVSLAGPRCPQPPCELRIENWTDLKPEFVTGSRIDFDRVWSAVINVTDSKDGVTLDRRSMVENGTDKSIQGQREVFVPPDLGYLVVERLLVQIKDAQKRDRPGQFIEISVESRLWKRKARSYRADEIKQGTTMSTGSQSVTVLGSDSAIMERIKRAIIKLQAAF